MDIFEAVVDEIALSGLEGDVLTVLLLIVRQDTLLRRLHT